MFIVTLHNLSMLLSLHEIYVTVDEADVGKHYFELWVKICKMVKISQIFNNVLKLSLAHVLSIPTGIY